MKCRINLSLPVGSRVHIQLVLRIHERSGNNIEHFLFDRNQFAGVKL